jgi:hypothetical protein
MVALTAQQAQQEAQAAAGAVARAAEVEHQRREEAAMFQSRFDAASCSVRAAAAVADRTAEDAAELALAAGMPVLSPVRPAQVSFESPVPASSSAFADSDLVMSQPGAAPAAARVDERREGFAGAKRKLDASFAEAAAEEENEPGVDAASAEDSMPPSPASDTTAETPSTTPVKRARTSAHRTLADSLEVAAQLQVALHAHAHPAQKHAPSDFAAMSDEGESPITHADDSLLEVSEEKKRTSAAVFGGAV